MIPLRTIRNRVSVMLRDTDAKNLSFSGVEKDMAICDAYLHVASRLPASEAYMTSDLTLTAGSNSAALASTVSQWTGNAGQREYAGKIEIRVRDTGNFLHRMTWDELKAWRHGQATIPQTEPKRFALIESKTQALTAYFDVNADQNYVCDVIATLMADDLRDYVGAGTDDADDVSLQLSRLGAEAVQYYAASDLVMRMIDEDLRERRLNPAVASVWRRDAERAIYKESERRHNLADVGRSQMRVS